jgi:hypothetical protein
VSLEDDVDSVSGREVGRHLEAVRLHLVYRAADQPRHLAGMRRDDDVTIVTADEPPGIVGEQRERVGVEHQRHGRAIDKAAHEFARLRCPAQARSARHDVVNELEHLLDR